MFGGDCLCARRDEAHEISSVSPCARRNAARLCIVARGGVAAAAAFLLAHGDTLEIPWASSLRAHKQSAPNMLLYWRAIQFASERGYRMLDFGRSTHDSGTYRFKRQWRAVPTRQYLYYSLAHPSS